MCGQDVRAHPDGWTSLRVSTGWPVRTSGHPNQTGEDFHMAAVAVSESLPRSDYLVALRLVGHGLIGGTAKDGVLRGYSDELSAGVFAALCALERDGYVVTCAPNPRLPGWYPATLTETGIP